MIPTPPGVCLFCLIGQPHPIDISELLYHELLVLVSEETDE
jgi:hypothetical protein